MKTYTFVIGSTDDFEHIEALEDYVEEHGTNGTANYSVFEYSVPEQLSDEDVTMIGRGLAFSHDWCMDDTFSFVIEGTLDGDAEQDMFEAGVVAREKLNEQKRSETQRVDPYEPFNSSDPINW